MRTPSMASRTGPATARPEGTIRQGRLGPREITSGSTHRRMRTATRSFSRKLSAGLVAVLAAVVFVPIGGGPAGALEGATPGAADPVGCTGYPEPRRWVGAQTWWRNTAAGPAVGLAAGQPGAGLSPGTDFGHVHLEACVPISSPTRITRMSAPFDIDFVIKLHDNPASVRRITSAWHTDSGEGTNYVVDPPDFVCAPGVHDCQVTWRVRINPADARYSGLQHLRTKVRVIDPDGNEMLPVLRVPIYVNNGKALDNYSGAFVQGIGWYSGSGYAATQLRNDYPIDPVKGVWRVEVRWPGFASFDGNSNNNSHNFISIDPNFHASPPNFGRVLLDRNNPSLNTTSCLRLGRQNCGSPTVILSIDTTTLVNGPHKLFIRNDGVDDRGSTNSGGLVIPFTVAN